MWPGGTRNDQTQSEGFPTNRRRFHEVRIGGDQQTPGEEFDVQCVFAKFFFPVTFLGGKKEVTLESLGFFGDLNFLGDFKRSLGRSWCVFFRSFINRQNYH